MVDGGAEEDDELIQEMFGEAVGEAVFEPSDNEDEKNIQSMSDEEEFIPVEGGEAAPMTPRMEDHKQK